MSNILILDDIRTFEDGDGRTFTHARTNADAVDALENESFDEIWIDWDLSATDKRMPTSEPFVKLIAKANPQGVQVRIITDMPERAAWMSKALGALTTPAVITTIGARWHADKYGPDWDDQYEREFFEAAGIPQASKSR